MEGSDWLVDERWMNDVRTWMNNWLNSVKWKYCLNFKCSVMYVTHKKTPLSASTKRRMLQLNGYECTDIKAEPGNWILPCNLECEKIKEITIYKDDTWIITLPNCGSTWIPELAWLIMNNSFFKSTQNQFFRMPLLELETLKKSYSFSNEEIV